MNILNTSISLVILLKFAIASESGMKEDVIEVVEEEGFESIKKDWEKWEKRNDLFDYVIMKSVEFIIGFIKKVDELKRPVLAALFIKRPDVVEKVLKKIEYDDNDLFFLAGYRPEIAESHENFFNSIDMIKISKKQEETVKWGVLSLFNA